MKTFPLICANNEHYSKYRQLSLSTTKANNTSWDQHIKFSVLKEETYLSASLYKNTVLEMVNSFRRFVLQHITIDNEFYLFSCQRVVNSLQATFRNM